MDEHEHRSPALIVIGGFAGTGKTAVSRQLSAELGIPRLGSDTLGRTIKESAGIRGAEVHAYWIAYDLLFHLCEEFIQSGVSAILDLTMGWEFQWQHVDSIIRQYPRTLFLPIILRCSHDTCIQRIRQRYESGPQHYDPLEVYTSEPKNIEIWKLLTHLDRPDIYFVDAGKPVDEVCQQIREHVAARLNAGLQP